MDKIKQDLTEKRFALHRAEKDLETTQNAVLSLKKKYRDAELSVDGVIAQEKERAKEAVVMASSSELEKELALCEEERLSLRKEKTAQLSYFSYDAMKTGIIALSPIGDETSELIHDLKQEAYDTVSKRFVDAYFTSLGKMRVSEADFIDALDKLRGIRDKFFARRDNRANRALSCIIEKMKAVEIGGDEERVSGLIIGISVLFIALSFVLFPIYAVVLASAYYLNLREAYLMKCSLTHLKVVEDNYRLMDKALETRTREEYNKKKESIEEEFGKAIALVDSDISTISGEISVARQRAVADFEFDDSIIRKDLQKSLDSLSFSINEQKRAEDAVKARITSLKAEITNLEEKYNEARQGVVYNYINFNRVGDSKFFPEKFLLNDQEPLVFFEKGRHSNFFVYKSYEMAMNFIKLIALQTRTRTVPNTVFTQVWDITSSGAALMSLSNPSTHEVSGLFNIANTTESVKEAVETLAAILQRRLQVIAAQGQDINKYNEDMIALNSVTESYHLVFVLSPEVLFGNEDFRRFIVNGPALGIYVYMFADITKLGDQYIPFIENMDFCAYILNDRVASNARSSMIEQVKNKKAH